jgi:hypothetical protein
MREEFSGANIGTQNAFAKREMHQSGGVIASEVEATPWR